MSFQKGNPGVFSQHIWDISATPTQVLGTSRTLGDGRKFVYSQAGAVALVAGNTNQSPVSVANHLNMDVAAAPTADSGAIGSDFITVTLGATAATVNQYTDGYIYHNKNGVLSQMYKVISHPAADASATLKVKVDSPLRVAAADADEFTLMKHPQDGVIIFPTTATGAPTGVATTAVTAAYYFWNQVAGPCACLCAGTLVLGDGVTFGVTTAGTVDPINYDGAGLDEVSIGSVMAIGTTAETALIMLGIPGY